MTHSILLMKVVSYSVIYLWCLLGCLINCVSWCMAVVCVHYMSLDQQKGSWFEVICLTSFLDSSMHFIHQINLSLFLRHVHTRVIFCNCACFLWSQGAALYAGTCLRCFPPRSSEPESKDTAFLTLISISPFWLDPGLKSITHHSSSYQQTDTH